ncbi:hypothetical protein OSB04_007488 [Centaurea solstitialis]|uniref:Uncharacterized protein n=1 Tax=Centaurea solstitialis TaxID=347529 RepID=A0AA38U4I7_9ASTR|nr:hypothetical protein OSB04_007488 [Centaurea solstitialis]
MAAIARGHGGDAGVILHQAQEGYPQHASRAMHLITTEKNDCPSRLTCQISRPINLSADRYKDRKAKQKKHFLDNGGYDDIQKARKHPLPSVKKDVWEETIDHFLDPKYRNRAKKSAANRAKARVPSLHGSSSYVSTREIRRHGNCTRNRGSDGDGDGGTTGMNMDCLKINDEDICLVDSGSTHTVLKKNRCFSYLTTQKANISTTSGVVNIIGGF